MKYIYFTFLAFIFSCNTLYKPKHKGEPQKYLSKTGSNYIYYYPQSDTFSFFCYTYFKKKESRLWQ